MSFSMSESRRGRWMSSSMRFYTGRYTGATTDYIEEKRKMDELIYELLPR